MAINPIYAAEPRPWDSDKYPYTNRGNASSAINDINANQVINSLSGVLCADVNISPDGKTITFTKNDTILMVRLLDITSIDRKGNVMTLSTDDTFPYFITFYSEDHLSLVENRLFQVMNGSSDPGCTMGFGDFSKSDFSTDFN